MNTHEQSAIVGYWRMTESIPLVAELIGFTDEVKMYLIKYENRVPSEKEIIKFKEYLVSQVLIDKKLINGK